MRHTGRGSRGRPLSRMPCIWQGSAMVGRGTCSTQRIGSWASLMPGTMMRERLPIRLTDGLQSRLPDAARARGTDLSSVVQQALMAYLEGVRGTAPTSVPPHTPEDCLAVVVGHASPRAQRHLTAVFARLEGILTRQGQSRLWFVAESLAHWAEWAEQRLDAADP
jgi:hypothetical protein